MKLRPIVVIAAALAACSVSFAQAESGRWQFSGNANRPIAVKADEADKKPAKKSKTVERQRTDRKKVRGEAQPIAATAEGQSGNSGELRSPTQPANVFEALFGGKPKMLPETRALDGVLASRSQKKSFKVKDEFQPQTVSFNGYPRGTIVVDTSARYLYLVETNKTARRYAIAVGRDGLQFEGKVKVGDKQEWPRWIPTVDMQKREPKKYGQYKDGMNGGPDNPLGARAIYLYDGRKDTYLRIHGTNQPQSIGTASSNGCFRMVNEHVMDLYSRVRVGTEVVVVKGLAG